MIANAPASAPATNANPNDEGVYELRFDSLFVEGRGLSFPCDAQGRVAMERLSDRARTNYLYARAVVGREFRTPAVMRADLH